jgi:hypothetical protein
VRLYSGRVFPPAAIAALSECIGRPLRPAIEGAGQREAHRQIDMSLFIGAPLGLGVLLALGILMVVMSFPLAMRARPVIRRAIVFQADLHLCWTA